MQRIFAALFALAALVAFGEKLPFERYQGVIDRYPFGQPPPDFNPNQMASDVKRDGSKSGEEELTPEQEALTKAVSFSVINLESDGQLMVGFTDLSVPNSPKHYYMRVGETRNGWFVKEADQGEKTMTVEKDGIEVSLSLGSSSKDVAVAKSGDGGAKGAARPAKSPLVAGAGETGAGMSLKARRAAKREAEREEQRARDEAFRREREEEKAAQREREEEMRREREAEREEQREQLRAIREELKRAREEKENADNVEDSGNEENDS